MSLTDVLRLLLCSCMSLSLSLQNTQTDRQTETVQVNYIESKSNPMQQIVFRVRSPDASASVPQYSFRVYQVKQL